MIAIEDKVLILRDEKENLVGIVLHDMEKRTHTFYSLSEMDMEEIKNITNKKND